MASVHTFKTLQLREYHELFLTQGVRTDGRAFDQFRDVIVAKNTVSTADGSSMVKLGKPTHRGPL